MEVFNIAKEKMNLMIISGRDGDHLRFPQCVKGIPCKKGVHIQRTLPVGIPGHGKIRTPLRRHDGKGNIDMAITALKNAEPVSAPADLTGYIDISSLAQLLQDFEYSYNYALGGGYRLTGTVQLDLKLGSLDIQ